MTKPTKDWRDEVALDRYQVIAPLLDEALDPAKRSQMRKRIMEESGHSERSLFRYEKAYRDNGFAGLKPVGRESRRKHPGLASNFDELLVEAIQLKREVPTRSVSQIIMILEMEGRAAQGQLARSTLQRHLYNAGFGKKQMKIYTQARRSSSKRYCPPHRMMLAQADIKYGRKLPIGKNGKSVQTYLSVVIDAHSRFVLHSAWFDNQEAEIVESTFRMAILKHGKIEKIMCDNGTQYKAIQLRTTLAKLGIKQTFNRPYSPSSKGCIEVFNRFVDSFLAETKAHKIKTLEELNNHWNAWLEAYYHEKPHEGIREYYESHGIEVPEAGISPKQEWSRDSRALAFLDAGVVGEAFLHHEKRKVDQAACISFKGKKYETSTALIGATIEISYDPMAPETIAVSYPGMKSFDAKPLVIGSSTSKKAQLPSHMLAEEPEESRFLTAIGLRHEAGKALKANAISFAGFKKEVDPHV
jgi:transposase InsO family protein